MHKSIKFNSLIAAAALLLAALPELLAQGAPVTSRNAAGYIKLTVAPWALYQVHYPLNSMDGAPVTVSDLMADLPNGSAVFFWDAESQSYPADEAAEVKLLGSWMPGTNNLCGRTFWLQVGNSTSSSFPIYLRGEIPDAWSMPVATNALAPSGPNTISLVGYAYPREIHWTNTTVAVSAQDGSVLAIYDAGLGKFQTSVKNNGAWSSDYILYPGQGFWLNARGVTNWVEVKPYLYP